jgi:hypothetical protein
MAESKNGSKSKAQAKRATTEAKKSAAKTVKASKRAATKTAAAETNQVRSVIETAVDVPVGAVLRVADRIQELFEPWTSRTTAERELRSYRTQLTRSVNRSERRGATARRKATTQAKRTRGRLEREVRRVEREARRRRRKATTTLRQNRRRLETQLRRNRRQAETQVRKATRQAEKVQADFQKTFEEQSSRAQEFVSSLV